MTVNYDVVVVGAGAGGLSCAYTAAKLGLKTLLIEKNIHSGGLITSGLVTPVMKLNDHGINTEFYRDLIIYAKNADAQLTYSDGNHGWFNPELLKSVFDSMLSDAGCDVMYMTEISDVFYKNNSFYLTSNSEMLSLHIETRYLVDGTGNGKIFEKLNLEFLDDKEEKQSTSLRFIMSNVECEEFAKWICQIDKDRGVTTSCKVNSQTHFSTAYTWDTNRDWALRPYFERAVADGVLKPADTAYFQIFTIPNMPGAVSFNCPRLNSEQNSNNCSHLELSKRIIEGRMRINRIAKFCKKYLKGFANAYISNISDMLGIRESARVKGRHVFSVQDIISGKKPKHPALASNYPIDIHSEIKNKGELNFSDHLWYLPIESLISEKYDNLFVVGRCLSAQFRAQAAVRTQSNCFSMGEAVAKHIKILQQKSTKNIEAETL